MANTRRSISPLRRQPTLAYASKSRRKPLLHVKPCGRLTPPTAVPAMNKDDSESPSKFGPPNKGIPNTRKTKKRVAQRTTFSSTLEQISHLRQGTEGKIV